jgi:competence protein ComEC
LGKVFGINPRISYLLTAILIFLFVPVTGARTPIIRAFIMTSAVLFSKVIDRDSCSYNSLSLAAVILLVMNPHQIFDIGFQLSFSACISILYFSNRFRPKQSERFAFGLLASAFRFIGVCVAAYLGTAPVILFYFGKVAAFGILSNVVVIPLVALILPFGFFLVGIGSISLTLANALGVGLSFLVEALFWLTSILPKPIFHLPNLTPLSVALLYSGMVVLVKIREIGAFKVAIGALVLINIFLYRSLFTPPTLEITFLDVGYGESIFIRFPYNGNMLIDGGSYWTGKWVVLPYLRYRGVERLDIVVATHSDSDHIGGLIPVLSQIKAEKVLFSQSTREEKMFLRFLSVAKESGAEIHKVMAGDRIDGFFGVEIEILNPGVRFLEDNNNSVVMRLRFSDFSILFTGDVEKKAQMQIVQKSVSSTVLKAPHHGLKSGYWQGFFEKVKPEIVVVAGGPADIEKGVYPNALYTREAGAITLLSSGRGYRVKMRN